MKSKSLLACLSGNVIEWYEFSLFVFFSAQISPYFFSISDPATSKIFILLTFAIGFISRPMGGIIFGVVGDIWGRKKALFFSVFLMTLANCLIGILPGYAEMGWIAPALLIVCRIAQGVSGGGEFTSSMVYLIENYKINQTLAGSLAYSSAQLGLLIGALVGFTHSYLAHQGIIPAESWRYLFFLCLPLGGISYYLRLHLIENKRSDATPPFLKKAQSILVLLFSQYKKEMLVVFLINALAMSVFYTFSLYVINWNRVESMHEFVNRALMNSCLLLTTIAFLPIFAKVSQRFTLAQYLFYTGLALIANLYPLVMSPDGFVKFATSILYALLIAAFLAPLPQFFCSVFPASVRNTGVAISLNLAAVLFGPSSAAVINYLAPKNLFIQSLYAYFLIIFFMATFGIFYADRKLMQKGERACTTQP